MLYYNVKENKNESTFRSSFQANGSECSKKGQIKCPIGFRKSCQFTVHSAWLGDSHNSMPLPKPRP